MHFWTSEKKPVLPPVFMLSQTQLVLIFFTVYYTELYDHLPIGCTVLTWLSFSDGNYSTTPFGAQSAAAVTRPAVPAPKDGPTGVTLFCQMRRFVRGFFLQVSLILFFFFFSLSGSNGFSHKSVLGPLIIVDPSDSQAHNIPQVSGSQVHWRAFHFKVFAITRHVS